MWWRFPTTNVPLMTPAPPKAFATPNQIAAKDQAPNQETVPLALAFVVSSLSQIVLRPLSKTLLTFKIPIGHQHSLQLVKLAVIPSLEAKVIDINHSQF